MTPIEFLYRLKQLPSDTRLNIAQLGAAFEMVSPMLKRSKGSQDNAPVSIDSEAALAEWLGEPLATIEGWRIQPESVQYRLAAVLEWIVQHIVPIEKIALPDSEGDAEGLVSLSDNVVDWFPCVIVDGCFVEYFTALDKEAEPTGYELLRADVLTFEASKIPQVQVMGRAASKAALGKFKREIVEAANKREKADEAKETYEAWKDKAMPDVLLQFFATALGYDEELACDIARGLDEELIRKRFNVSAWLWTRWMDGGFSGIGTVWLRNEFMRTLVNKRTEVIDSRGRVVFQGAVSHLLADTTGKLSGLPPLEIDCIGEYQDAVIELLDLGMNVDLENSSGLTARRIAEDIEYSPFLEAVKRYEGKEKLEATLPTKPNASSGLRKQPV